MEKHWQVLVVLLVCCGFCVIGYDGLTGRLGVLPFVFRALSSFGNYVSGLLGR